MPAASLLGGFTEDAATKSLLGWADPAGTYATSVDAGEPIIPT